MHAYPRLVIAGVRGGSGKTVVSLAVIAGLGSIKRLQVTPFKKGPDYIDAGWLSTAAGMPCYNLDPFFLSGETIMNSFASHARTDIAVIEGNRGLHDGMDAGGSCSTAELAKLLHAPVILVIDCTKMTRTSAAVVLGCMHLDTGVEIKGVVLNQVAGHRHESVVRESINKYCSLPVLGVIPRLAEGELPERHMGLTPCQEHPDTAKVIALAEEIAAKYLDMDAIAGIAMAAEPLRTSPLPPFAKGEISVRIGVIRDAAFQFYYPENLEELEKNGAQIIDINALADAGLPDIDALYIGGGFPETNALQLAGNAAFRDSVRTMIERGLPVYAECGGLMFLGQSIVTDGGQYPMAGVFPIVFDMKKKPQAHGYTIVEVDSENPFYPVGTVLHGHEFHYSAVEEKIVEKMGTATVFNKITNSKTVAVPIFSTAFAMRRGKGIKDKRDGICYKNVLATYTHVHALGSPEWAIGLIRCADKYRKKGTVTNG
ncbi:MAG: hydrogenobyrinic acid a,c-diamide synthase (glutamine-hydrolyzing) [Nitrospirae bacterium]|nr:hydrogenobyrinic acid a,c-diamide synthase (glutamine-hydrolyzing) [Nitrospirota bacterium]